MRAEQAVCRHPRRVSPRRGEQAQRSRRDVPMTHSNVLKTNLLVSGIMLVGFILTAFFSHQANYRASLNSIEQISSLTADGIYYQLASLLTRPVNIAQTMAQDSLLIEHLARESARLEDAEYVRTIRTYLATYREMDHFDSVFLISTATGRYYSPSGIDRVLTGENPENGWYYKFLASDNAYSLNVDNDEVAGAGNAIAVFVNCKIFDDKGNVIGIVGIGIHTEYLKRILREYEEKYGVEVFLLDQNGNIQVSIGHTGDEEKQWFKTYGMEQIQSSILDSHNSETNFGVWASSQLKGQESWYVVARYMPGLSWYLLVEQNTSQLVKNIKSQVFKSLIVIFLIIASVLAIITIVIRNFNRKITNVIEQRLVLFRRATEQLYDNIYEWNITAGRCVGKNTEEYFSSIGAEGLSYDEGLRIIAEKQIHPEFREGYISLFNTKNVLREFHKGNQRLSHDLMITRDGKNWHWMRIDAHVFYSPDDDSVHMFTYRKNIDAEKRKEALANIDEMTGCYTKTATERMIDRALVRHPDTAYAFFIFDIDNFKRANDGFGHAFGDLCIREFSSRIRKHFREHDIVGRIGGDEFVAFIPIPNTAWAKEKARELVSALNFVCSDGKRQWQVSASIGVAIAPADGKRFIEMYRSADAALYQTKQGGKNNFTINRR